MSISDEATLMNAMSKIEAGEAVSAAMVFDDFENADAEREVRQILSLSRTFGSEVLPALRELHDLWMREGEHRQLLESELAAPMLTKRIIGWLPVGAFAVAQLMGFDVIAAATSPPVAFSLALGCAMLFVSQRWCGQILAKAHLEPDAVVTELKAALLVVGSGATWLQAKGHLQLSRETLDAVAPDIALARRSGAPVGPVLRRLIRLRQTHLDAEATRKVREAGVKLSLPMGFAMLPALVFLVVIPIFAAITNPQIGIT